MECETYNAMLSAYADGVLRPREAARVSEHLGCCRRCREDLAEIRALRDLLRALPRPEPRPDFWRNAHRRIRLRSHPRRRLRVPAVPHHGWAIAAGAAILALLMSAPRPVDPALDAEIAVGRRTAVAPAAAVSADALVALHATASAREPLSDAAALHYSSAESHAADWSDGTHLDSD